jgi:hypothetical protein
MSGYSLSAPFKKAARFKERQIAKAQQANIAAARTEEQQPGRCACGAPTMRAASPAQSLCRTGGILTAISLGRGINVLPRGSREVCMSVGEFYGTVGACRLLSKQSHAAGQDLTNANLIESLDSANLTRTLALAAGMSATTPILAFTYTSGKDDAEANFVLDVSFTPRAKTLTADGAPEITNSFEIRGGAGVGNPDARLVPYSAVVLLSDLNNANVAQIQAATVATPIADPGDTYLLIRGAIENSGLDGFLNADIDLAVEASIPGTLIVELLVPGSRYWGPVVDMFASTHRPLAR